MSSTTASEKMDSKLETNYSENTNGFERPFNVNLVQVTDYDGNSHLESIGSIFITFNTLEKICKKERVLVWNLPLATLQMKIGESGRFILPGHGIIDDIFGFTLNDYREDDLRNERSKKHFPESLRIYWLREKTGNENASGQAAPKQPGPDADNGKSLLGPMKEKDWDYVFQANKILNCSLVNPETSRVERSTHAAFRLRTSNEDDAEPNLPQDDKEAKIPVWSLPEEPSRTYICQTHSELETSAMQSGHSKKSFNIGLSGAYKLFSAEGKYERTTENAYKDEKTYGRKQDTMLTIHEIPIVELNLDKSNSRISDACRQALQKLRDRRNFGDLMEFFDKYGTIYAKKVVLGGRLISSRLFNAENIGETETRETKAKHDASISLGIDPISIKGGYSDERSQNTESEKKAERNQLEIDWTSYGGNAALASDPDKWLPSVPDYKYWKVIQNTEVESIQDFIGQLPGWEDIPVLFQDILSAGLYNPEVIHLGPRPALPGQQKLTDDAPRSADIGAAINTLSMGPKDAKNYPFASNLAQHVTSRVLARGGVSWQILDSRDSVKLEVSSVLQTSTNTGANRSVIPNYLYKLSIQPRTVSVVLQWSSDLIEKGLNLSSPGVAQVETTYRTLRQLAPQQCAEVLEKVKGLEAGEKFAGSKNELDKALEAIKSVTPYSSLAFFRINYWIDYLTTKITDDEKRLISVRAEIESLPDEDLMSSFWVTDEVKGILKDGNLNDGIKAVGRGFVESFTEKASITAVWTLSLPIESTEEDFYAFRLLIQKFFLGPRTISEACDFFELQDANKSKLAPATKVSIFGYCDEIDHRPIEVNNKSPSVAPHYLTLQALQRNKKPQTLKLRAWKGLDIHDLPPKLSIMKDVDLVAPEEFYVLNVRKAERLLLLLSLYSKVKDNGIDPNGLKRFGRALDKILDPVSLDMSGKMDHNKRTALKILVRDLEIALPDHDPEKLLGSELP